MNAIYMQTAAIYNWHIDISLHGWERVDYRGLKWKRGSVLIYGKNFKKS